MQDDSVSYQGDIEFDAFAIDGAAFGSGLHKGEKMNAKIPPAFNGYRSWWSFAELVKDWCEITVIEKKARAPMLRNRLVGHASVLSANT